MLQKVTEAVNLKVQVMYGHIEFFILINGTLCGFGEGTDNLNQSINQFLEYKCNSEINLFFRN